MAKLSIPSVRRPVCSHANDSDFRFCQRCGYRRRVLTSATTKPPSVDLASINSGAPRAREARTERSTMGKKIW